MYCLFLIFSWIIRYLTQRFDLLSVFLFSLAINYLVQWVVVRIITGALMSNLLHFTNVWFNICYKCSHEKYITIVLSISLQSFRWGNESWLLYFNCILAIMCIMVFSMFQCLFPTVLLVGLCLWLWHFLVILSHIYVYRHFSYEWVNIFFLFLNQTYVVSTQKNRLYETVLFWAHKTHV